MTSGASPLAIAAAVRSNLTIELGRIDVAVSSRATLADVLAQSAAALAAINLDGLMKNAVPGALSGTIHNNSVLGHPLSSNGWAFDFSRSKSMSGIYDSVTVELGPAGGGGVGEVPPYLIVELPPTQTALATPGAYDIQVEAKWVDNTTVTIAPYGQLQFVRDIQRLA